MPKGYVWHQVSSNEDDLRRWQSVTRQDRFVFDMLAANLSPGNISFLTAGGLVKKTGLSRTAVYKSIKALIEGQFLLPATIGGMHVFRLNQRFARVGKTPEGVKQADLAYRNEVNDD